MKIHLVEEFNKRFNRRHGKPFDFSFPEEDLFTFLEFIKKKNLVTQYVAQTTAEIVYLKSFWDFLFFKKGKEHCVGCNVKHILKSDFNEKNEIKILCYSVAKNREELGKYELER